MGKMGKIRLRKISKLKFRPYFIWYYDFIPIKVSENHNDHGHISCNTLDIRCVIYRGIHIGCNKMREKFTRLISKWKIRVDFFCWSDYSAINKYSLIYTALVTPCNIPKIKCVCQGCNIPLANHVTFSVTLNAVLLKNVCKIFILL